MLFRRQLHYLEFWQLQPAFLLLDAEYPFRQELFYRHLLLLHRRSYQQAFYPCLLVQDCFGRFQPPL